MNYAGSTLARSSTLALVLALAAACSRAPELVRAPEHPPEALVLRNGAVLDVASGRLLHDRDVFIEGERIVSVVPTGALPAPDGAREIDARNATVLPGLIDMHAHTTGTSDPPGMTTLPDPEANLRAYLYCGVTTVLDAASIPSDIVSLRARVRDGEILGPRIYAAGPFVTARDGHPAPMLRKIVPWWLEWYVEPRMTRQIVDGAGARAAVDEIADFGVDVVKLGVDRIPADAPRLSRRQIEAIVAEARTRGLRAVAHIGATQDAIDAAEGGISAWMHGVYKERIPDDEIAKLASYGIPMVPTLEVFDSYSRLGEGPREATELERETVAPEILAAFDGAGDLVPEGFRDFLAVVKSARLARGDNVRRLHDRGVTILAGSDTQTAVFPGASLHRELAQLVRAGLSPAQAIRAATLDPARFLENTDDPSFGVVAAGKRADLLIVNGDPTADVGATSRIRTVIRRGVVVERIAVAARP